MTDAGVAGLLARAAGEGACWNVEINLKSMPTSADKDNVAADLAATRVALYAAESKSRAAVEAAMNA